MRHMGQLEMRLEAGRNGVVRWRFKDPVAWFYKEFGLGRRKHSENIWQFMPEIWRSNRVFNSYEEILDRCCRTWNKLVEHPWTQNVNRHREWPMGSIQ